VGGAFLPTPYSPLGYDYPLETRGFQWIGIDGGPGVFIVAFYALNPQSIGTTHIQDRDPLTIPKTSENLLSNPTDLDSIVNVYQQQITALNTQLQLIDPLYTLISPSLETIADRSLLEEYIKENLDHAHHWTGTCKMSPLKLGGVVDGEGRVHGVSGLSVADISVAPIQPRSNTAGPAYAVGYKVAKAIISRHI
jgi:choline dehydrogenase